MCVSGFIVSDSSTLVQIGWYHGAGWQLRPCRRMSCQLFCYYQNCCVKHMLYKKGRVHMGNIVQQDLLKQLEQLRQDAGAALAQAGTSEATRAWYAEYLGRKGELTAILRNVGSLPAEERPLVGKVANEVKDFLEGVLQERQAAIAQAELEAARRAESVDVTLPGRP